MTTATMTNDKPRKQLSDQLDRLDGILDALSEGLTGSVTDAASSLHRPAPQEFRPLEVSQPPFSCKQ